MNTLLETGSVQTSPSLRATVTAACRRIPPLWPLKNFVAVNPFLGLIDRSFTDTASLLQRVGHGEVLMPAAFYREQIAKGRITEADLPVALALAGKTWPPAWRQALKISNLTALRQSLDGAAAPATGARLLSFAEFVDARHGTAWSPFIVEEISKWCSVYFDQGQSSWRMPWRDQPLFVAWRAAARLDANPELNGWKGFRALVAELPADPEQVIEQALIRLGVPAAAQVDFLHRQLLSIAGWSSHVQFLVREKSQAGQSDDALAQLLAIRLAYELALRQRLGDHANLLRAWQQELAVTGTAAASQASPELVVRHLAQLAFECGYQRSLLAQLKAPAAPPAPAPRTLQAIFCIDVRSEVFRRALEAESPEIETIGFAGFFGMVMEYLRFGQGAGGAQCPVLLVPKLKVREALHHAGPAEEERLRRRMNFRQTVGGAWNAFKTSAISCFSFVETAGLVFGARLVRDALALAPAETAFAPGGGRFGPRIQREVCCAATHGQETETGILLADQITMAAGALKNMGLTQDFARIVLICGHGSATTNNPYGSALDCGACGGHAGDANARVAANILNSSAVRAALAGQGIHLPATTRFVAGLHNTTTDEVVLYDTEELDGEAAEALAKIKPWLAAASRTARGERAAALGLAAVPAPKLDQAVIARSLDWAQVRPEWGLAGNAAFVAAPRERTKGLNLGGRVFLHNYAASRDPDTSVLELIMVAPMVVASWINLQYYGSTVNNRLFGSGNKTIHNVVGTFGVWQGNGGDLQTGLPLQSLHDGVKWVHEPLRLSVFLEASREAINQVIEKHGAVRELVDHGWIHLFALEPAGACWRYQSHLSWQEAGD